MLIVGKEGVEEMKKTTENQTKKKGMQLVATFGAVTLIALGALAVGLMNPKEGKTPNPIDLNATPTPVVQKQDSVKQDVAKQDTAKLTTPVPTAPPKQDVAGSQLQQEQTMSSEQTAEVAGEIALEESENVAVLNPDSILNGLSFSSETGMLWPVTGETIVSFSPDHAIYHKTLDSYRTSDYVLISGEIGTPVAAAADGVVTAVKEELTTGMTVTMRVSENSEIVYGLLSEVAVKEGDFVDAGTVIATIATPTRYYSEEGSGVYVQVLENGEAVNPMLFLR